MFLKDYDIIMLEIGSKGHMSDRDRDIAARAFRLARDQYPTAKIAFAIGGYDEDPRELYDIPEAKAYIRQWAHKAGLADWRVATRVPWIPEYGCLGILQLCGCFTADSPITVNTPDGLRRR